MARGLRREVRYDRPGTSESREDMMRRTRNDYFNRTKPSMNRPKNRRVVPLGCVSVWRVHKWDGKRNTYFGIYRDEEVAYAAADAEWDKVIGPDPYWSRGSYTKMEVEHKGAMLIDGRYFIVNLDPIKFTEPPENVAVLLGGTGQEAVQ